MPHQHTSRSAKSNCTQQYVKDYFRLGLLPEKGTVCESDEKVFDNVDSTFSPDFQIPFLAAHASASCLVP
jgi:hypothetical protein